MTATQSQTGLNEQNILCDLSHIGLLEITGPDAISFLQGQVTNDVKLLAGNNAHYTAYCNPKGRMLALFLAFAQNGQLYLQLNRALIEPITKRLKMYVLRSKVEIKDVSDSIIKFGIAGPQATQILTSNIAKIPVTDYELTTLENISILKLPAISGARYEILTDRDNAAKLLDVLKSQCQLVEKPAWDRLEIQAGIPDIEAKTQEQFVPQMLNLDILNGINFKKGCYTGQEIVARTHYLGTVKRRTYLADISPANPSDQQPQAGDKLLDTQGNEAGQIVRVAPNADNDFAVLAELRIEVREQEKVYWNQDMLDFKALPYSLED